MRNRDNKYRWLFFHLLMLVVILVPPYSFIHNFDISLESSIRISVIFLIIIPCYIVNVVFLVPFFLQKRNYGLYLLGVVSLIIVYYLGTKLVMPFDGHGFFVQFNPRHLVGMPLKAISPPPFLPFLILILTLGTSFEMLIDWEKRGKVIEKTKKEKLSAELSFLKSQINPHFFFNTLNSIYALAANNAEDTQRAILLLSNLMRYVLYDSNVEKVPLSKEIRFLNDFIDLQKLRYTNSNGKTIEFTCDNTTAEFDIEPLLLMPFVENAFKHSHSYNKRSEIKVSLESEGNGRLLFKVSNTIGEHVEEIERNVGIGLGNIQRRLDLLYPDRHRLDISQIDNQYHVVLELWHSKPESISKINLEAKDIS